MTLQNLNIKVGSHPVAIPYTSKSGFLKRGHYLWHKLRGHPGVWKHYRATWTILTIKVHYIGQSQPLTHGLVGQWSASSLGSRQMELICSCLAVHHHIHHPVRSWPCPREARFCIEIWVRLSSSLAEYWTRALSALSKREFLNSSF